MLNKIDDMGRGAWFALTIALFWVAWPLALGLLAFLAYSGRLRTFREGLAEGPGTWFGAQAGRGWGGFRSTATASSGNEAFDAYREETLRRLEEEKVEFQSFLERLRKARDKAEFDAFMAERRPHGEVG